MQLTVLFSRKETFRHRSADVARCWAKYGLNLLAFSQARLLRLAANTEDTESSPETLSNGGISLQALAETSEVDIGEHPRPIIRTNLKRIINIWITFYCKIILSVFYYKNVIILTT
jgi:hypothetical protein